MSANDSRPALPVIVEAPGAEALEPLRSQRCTWGWSARWDGVSDRHFRFNTEPADGGSGREIHPTSLKTNLTAPGPQHSAQAWQNGLRGLGFITLPCLERLKQSFSFFPAL